MVDEKHPFITLYCSHDGHPLNIQLGCGERTCPTCRRKWYGRHLNPILYCIKGWPETYFMTLTLKNIDGNMYRSDVVQLRRDFKRLLFKLNTKIVKVGEKSILVKRDPPVIKGGFYVVQATNEGRGWHLHLHVLYDGSFIAKERLSRLWANITSGSYIVNNKRAWTRKKAIEYLLSDFLQSPGIRPEDYTEYNAIFKGQRLVQPFGVYKNTKFRKRYACPICGGTCWVFLDDLLGVKRSFKRIYDDEMDSS